MRYPQIMVCLTILFPLSAKATAERPPHAPPVDERLTGIEAKLADHEQRLEALEGKTAAKACPCPNGPCACDPESCTCSDCPEHVRTALDAKLRILAFSADWCGPCKVAESEAKSAGVYDRVIHYDLDRDRKTADMLGVTRIPCLLLVKDEKVIDRHVGSMGYVEQIREWIENPTPKIQSATSPLKSRVIRTDTPPVRYYRRAYYQPRTYYQPSYSYGGGCYGGGCATCR